MSLIKLPHPPFPAPSPRSHSFIPNSMSDGGVEWKCFWSWEDEEWNFQFCGTNFGITVKLNTFPSATVSCWPTFNPNITHNIHSFVVLSGDGRTVAEAISFPVAPPVFYIRVFMLPGLLARSWLVVGSRRRRRRRRRGVELNRHTFTFSLSHGTEWEQPKYSFPFPVPSMGWVTLQQIDVRFCWNYTEWRAVNLGKKLTTEWNWR